MRHLAIVTLSVRELDRLKCIRAMVDETPQPVRAPERLGLITSWQIRRLAFDRSTYYRMQCSWNFFLRTLLTSTEGIRHLF
jgi:hypothetical protein